MIMGLASSQSMNISLSSSSEVYHNTTRTWSVEFTLLVSVKRSLPKHPFSLPRPGNNCEERNTQTKVLNDQ